MTEINIQVAPSHHDTSIADGAANVVLPPFTNNVNLMAESDLDFANTPLLNPVHVTTH